MILSVKAITIYHPQSIQKAIIHFFPHHRTFNIFKIILEISLTQTTTRHRPINTPIVADTTVSTNEHTAPLIFWTHVGTL